jgi:hypothetical protein
MEYVACIFSWRIIRRRRGLGCISSNEKEFALQARRTFTSASRKAERRGIAELEASKNNVFRHVNAVIHFCKKKSGGNVNAKYNR